MMRLTKYSHACVRLEGDGVLVIDPGVFSEPAALDGVDAVLITHEHADHLNLDMLTEALSGRPEVRIFTHPEVVPKLGDLGSVTTPVNSGDDFTAAGFAVRAYGGWHALIHPDIPRIPNLGYVIDETLYHPGDSFDVPADARIETLFVPVSAPWLKVSETIDFIRAVKPARAYALHDTLLAEPAVPIIEGLLGRLAGAEYQRLAPGTTVDV
jgi:L-ascorbate metabolism protein UlaG (beta-lactamase superfamily)